MIAAFVIFSGTTSRGETLTKGWQRLIGTALGVPAGVLIATAVGGDTTWSLILVFVCMFCGFYLLKVAYGLMIFWITTMLALLYGLLGEFTVGLLLLRIGETAIGAAVGAAVAILVLPTSTGATIRDAAHTYLAALADLVEAATQALLGEASARNLTEQARGLDQRLQQLRSTAQLRTTGIVGLVGRGSARHGLHVLTACDHYARTVARSGIPPGAARADPALASALTSGAAQTRRNIDALAKLVDHREQKTLHPAADLLDTAEHAIAGHRGGEQAASAANRRLRTAVRSLRHIDQAVVGLAHDLDGGQQTSAETAPGAEPA